eukprot:4338515-Karenia_brevis.AAC.1
MAAFRASFASCASALAEAAPALRAEAAACSSAAARVFASAIAGWRPAAQTPRGAGKGRWEGVAAASTCFSTCARC